MTTPKNETLVFNKFLRKYHDALAKLEITESISIKDTHKILSYLGYVDNLVSDQTLQLCHTIAYMLSPERDCKITRRNLFEFLRVISDIKSFPSNTFYQEARPLQNEEQQSFGDEPLVCLRIGTFNQKMEWSLNATEETEVKNIFGFMNLNRISRQHIKAEQKDNSEIFEEETFQPEILHKSKELAEKRSKRVSLSNSKVEERLLQSQSLKKSKLEEKVRRSVEKEMRECPFKPKINRKSVSIVNSSMYKFVDSMDNSFENRENVVEEEHERGQYNSIVSRNSLATRYANNNSNNNSVINNNNSLEKSFGNNKVENKLLNKGKEYEERLSKLADEYKQMSDEINMKECTFQPRINHNNNNRNFNNNINKNSNKENNPSNNISRLSSSSKLSSNNNKNNNKNNNRHNNNNPSNITIPNPNTTHPTFTPTPIRNAEKSIERMKEARRIREFENQLKERGYPKNIAWTKYINSSKSSIINEFNNNVSKKSPILCIDLKIMESTKNLKVYEGQCLAEISESICVDNSVPFEHWGKVEELLRNSIELCNEVRICDNKVYLRVQ